MSEEKQNPKKIKNTHEGLFQADFVILEIKQTTKLFQQLKKISFLCEQLK